MRARRNAAVRETNRPAIVVRQAQEAHVAEAMSTPRSPPLASVVVLVAVVVVVCLLVL